MTSGIVGVGGSSRVPWVGRNTFIGPGANSIDLRLSRDIRIAERVHWLLIAEAFNLANRYEITGIDTTQYQIGGTTLFPRAVLPDAQCLGHQPVRRPPDPVGNAHHFLTVRSRAS